MSEIYVTRSGVEVDFTIVKPADEEYFSESKKPKAPPVPLGLMRSLQTLISSRVNGDPSRVVFVLDREEQFNGSDEHLLLSAIRQLGVTDVRSTLDNEGYWSGDGLLGSEGALAAWRPLPEDKLFIVFSQYDGHERTPLFNCKSFLNECMALSIQPVLISQRLLDTPPSGGALYLNDAGNLVNSKASKISTADRRALEILRVAMAPSISCLPSFVRRVRTKLGLLDPRYDELVKRGWKSDEQLESEAVIEKIADFGSLGEFERSCVFGAIKDCLTQNNRLYFMDEEVLRCASMFRFVTPSFRPAIEEASDRVRRMARLFYDGANRQESLRFYANGFVRRNTHNDRLWEMFPFLEVIREAVS